MKADKFNKRIYRLQWTNSAMTGAEIWCHNKWIVSEKMISIYSTGDTLPDLKFNYCRHEVMHQLGFRPFNGSDDFDE